MKKKKYTENLWSKFYECDCHDEGLMMSYDTNYDGIASIDIAFFNMGIDNSRKLTLKKKLRWCWHILLIGIPFTDMVMLNQTEAKRLAKDLLKFANKKFRISK